MIPTIILVDGNKIELNCGDHLLDRTMAKSIPNRRYSQTRKVWRAPASLAVFNFLDRCWPLAKWSDDATSAWMFHQKEAARREVTLAGQLVGFDEGVLGDYQFATKPYDHQRQALAASVPHNMFAYLMDQGTGKTWTSINWLGYKRRADTIKGAIVIVPNSIKHQWGKQIEQHGPHDSNVGYWHSQPKASQRRAEEDWADDLTREWRRTTEPFHWFIVNCEALAMARCEEFLLKILKTKPMAIVVDESTRFKNRNASRTKALLRLRLNAPCRMIMSGTPIIKSPMDSFAQFNFLDPGILGFDNFFSFRNYYGIMGGYKGKKVVSFKNMEGLGDRIKSSSFRVTKDECLDLPAKVGGVTDPAGYRFRKVKMGKEQRTEYNRMREELLALLDDICKTCDGAGFVNAVINANGHVGDRHTMMRSKRVREARDDETSVCPECDGEAKAVIVKIRLTQLLRLQQITSGFITDGPDVLHWFDGDSLPPKIKEAVDIIEDAPTQQGITWSIFRPELERMAQELARREIKFIEIHGGIHESLRPGYIEQFMSGEVGHSLMHPAAGGIGLDMWRAQYATYLSNSAKTEDRVQSEDRCHRIGSEIHASVDYHDVAVPGTIDMKVLRDLRADTERSGIILGDTIRELIT